MDLTLMDLKEAAEHLHATVHFVRGIIATDELRFVKIGKKFCVTRGDLNLWVERNRLVRSELDELGESLGQQKTKPLRSVG